ncbi:hypothetical protein DFJ58DRAFT_129653 [Suillus subalutaceus]|uniref:uncharacterized protein n=1 Tax=Suillus subalutaceus TaxID=48586 RepID=UPI001B886F41|nr:uncharacterized protein DFJ58DRAFT_129653 [Suillus subalutaceus]KAG1867243.1 hypothetical protein DFJ58DRAFT_129653 [Suillus subalutaceus]
MLAASSILYILRRYIHEACICMIGLCCTHWQLPVKYIDHLPSPHHYVSPTLNPSDQNALFAGQGFHQGLRSGQSTHCSIEAPTQNGRTQRSSTTAHHEGDDFISADITDDFRFVSPLYSNSLPREPGPEFSTNASSTRCSWGESSARKAPTWFRHFTLCTGRCGSYSPIERRAQYQAVTYRWTCLSFPTPINLGGSNTF